MLWNGGDIGDWQLETTGCSLETKMGTGDDVGDVAAVEWQRESTLSAWGVERRMVCYRLRSGDDVGVLAAWEWR